MEWKQLLIVPKLLKRWSGRRGSNPRRPAWEYEQCFVFSDITAHGVDSGYGKRQQNKVRFRRHINGGFLEGVKWLPVVEPAPRINEVNEVTNRTPIFELQAVVTPEGDYKRHRS